MEQQRPNNEQQRPNMQEHRPVEQQRPNNEQQRPPNMEVHGPIEQQRPPNMEERRPNEPQRPNNEQQRPPNMEERRPMNEQQRPPNIEEHRPMNEQQRPNNEVLNRIDHREAAMYEMNQQQMHKMDSLDNKLDFAPAIWGLWSPMNALTFFFVARRFLNDFFFVLTVRFHFYAKTVEFAIFLLLFLCPFIFYFFHYVLN